VEAKGARIKDEPKYMQNQPVDADKPLLEELERLVLEGDDKEFEEGLEWLTKEIYQNPEVMSLLDNSEFLGTISEAEVFKPVVNPDLPEQAQKGQEMGRDETERRDGDRKAFPEGGTAAIHPEEYEKIKAVLDEVWHISKAKGKHEGLTEKQIVETFLDQTTKAFGITENSYPKCPECTRSLTFVSSVPVSGKFKEAWYCLFCRNLYRLDFQKLVIKIKIKSAPPTDASGENDSRAR
jgi:hypothetical protein